MIKSLNDERILKMKHNLLPKDVHVFVVNIGSVSYSRKAIINFVFGVLSCLVIFGTVGCVHARSSSREVIDLKSEVARLQIRCDELERNQGNLQEKIDSSLKSLNALMYDLQNKFSAFGDTAQKLEIAADVKNDDKSSSVVLPSSLYQSAYSDYSMGKYDLAYSAFQSFVDKYPDDVLAVESQFYMGECLYSRKMWSEALIEYGKVKDCYKKSYLVPAAMLKIALCYEKLGKNDDAENTFSFILENFPQSSESLMARGKIKTYRNVQST
ncbi:MAG: tetratricopeptide repeat protein [Endomicrobium sp.]|jgi:tol-pal system protein YbgF|nr:tetratricopeptide repeat protein [Endomicrobium sp.]